MAEILPFRAYRYDANRFKLQDVLTQPYDKISIAMQDRYYTTDPYNLIPIEKGRTLAGDSTQENVYTRAAAKVSEWISNRVLIQDPQPSIYVYAQEFVVPGTQTRRTRIGFIALLRIEDYEKHVVFRHERTLSAPKADRIELLRHTHAQTGQLFLLYDDPAKKIDSWLEQIARTRKPIEMADEFGVTHRLWAVEDGDLVAQIQNAMKDKPLVIADGHHRYETALAFRNECRERTGRVDSKAPSEFAMATFINTHSRGLTILATHRLILRLPPSGFEGLRDKMSPYFDWYSYPFTSPEERAVAFEEFRKDLERGNHSRRTIGVYPRSEKSETAAFYLFALKRDVDLEDLLPDIPEAERELDVVLLHRLILEKGFGLTAEAVAAEKNLAYERETDAALAAVDGGGAEIAFLLNPVRVEQVMRIALGGGVLPQKSTDFYPKLLSGLAIYRTEGC
jgi:uncharacterized protein (DUF1015 family)